MFKQFVSQFTDSRIYLIVSLWLFLVFFVAVVYMLIKMSKQHIDYMSRIPLTDDQDQNL